MTESRTGRRSTFQKEQSSFSGAMKVTCSPHLSFFPLGSTTSTCPSPVVAHTTEGKQDGLLSQQISEKTEGSCVSVGSATSQLCDFGLLNIPLKLAFGTVVCRRPTGGIELLMLRDWEFLNWTKRVRVT